MARSLIPVYSIGLNKYDASDFKLRMILYVGLDE
jgi:hypothetical protein